MDNISKILIDFTDEKITPSGGSFFLVHVSSLLGLPHLLNTLKLKSETAAPLTSKPF